MKLKYTDYFTSKYRYGTLYPKGIPYGTRIHDLNLNPKCNFFI